MSMLSVSPNSVLTVASWLVYSLFSNTIRRKCSFWKKERALPQLQLQALLVKFPEDELEPLSSRIHQDVVKVHEEHIEYVVSEHVLHQSLVRSGRVTQTKRHAVKLENSPIGVVKAVFALSSSAIST